MHAFTVIDESVLDVTACAGLCMMTGDGMVARDGMAAGVAWRPDGMVARDGGQMAWWLEMVARWHGGRRWQFYLAQKNAGPVHIFQHASIVIV